MTFREWLKEKEEKRWVYGTRDNKWHLVGKDDRDYEKGITQDEMKKLGKDKAKEKYLGKSHFIGAK